MDLLRWYVTKVVVDLMCLPKTEVAAYLLHVRQSLVAECDLHPVEAELITNTAGPMLERLDFPPFFAPEGWQALADHLHESWDALQERYVSIVSSSPQR